MIAQGELARATPLLLVLTCRAKKMFMRIAISLFNNINEAIFYKDNLEN